MPTAKLNGIDIYYEEHGSGPAIIPTHGLGDSASLWAPPAEARQLRLLEGGEGEGGETP